MLYKPPKLIMGLITLQKRSGLLGCKFDAVLPLPFPLLRSMNPCLHRLTPAATLLYKTYARLPCLAVRQHNKVTVASGATG